MKKLIRRVKIAVARFLVRRTVRMGFVVLPATRANDAIGHARDLEVLLRSKGSNFRDREGRRQAISHSVNVSASLKAGVDEVLDLVEYVF